MKASMVITVLVIVFIAGLTAAQTLPPILRGSFTDPRDGQTYKTIRVGKLEFMAQNLNYNAGKGCWIYNNDPRLAAIYGRLYNWETAVNAVSPPGWHLPTEPEWQQLIDYLGGVNVAGSKLKEKGTTHWEPPNTGATDEIGFTGLPGGYRFTDSTFREIKHTAAFWSSTEYDLKNAYPRMLNSVARSFYCDSYCNKQCGFSVRLIRDY